MNAILQLGGVGLLLIVLIAFEAATATYNRVSSGVTFQVYFKNLLMEKYGVDLDDSVIGIFLEEFIDSGQDKVNILKNLIYLNMGVVLVNPMEDYFMDKLKKGGSTILGAVKNMKLPSWANKSAGVSKAIDIFRGDLKQDVKRTSDYSYQAFMTGSNIAQSFNNSSITDISKEMKKKGLTPNSSTGSQEVLREILNLEKVTN